MVDLGVAIGLLTVGALLLGGAAFRVSTRFGLNPVVSGVVVVGFTTSFPEVISTGLAAEQGASALAFATLVGSNAFNSLFILGVVVLIAQSKQPWREVRFDAWAALAVCVVPIVAVLMPGAPASRHILAVICLSCLGAYTLRAAVGARPERAVLGGSTEAGVAGVEVIGRHFLLLELGTAFIGVVLLTVGSNNLVQQVLSHRVADMDVVGSTLVAAATSLPELLVAIYAASRGWTAIAVGSVLGSNVFNMLGAFGGALLVAPLPGIGGHPLLDAGLMTIGAAVAVLVLRERIGLSHWIAAAMVVGWMACAATRFVAG